MRTPLRTRPPYPHLLAERLLAPDPSSAAAGRATVRAALPPHVGTEFVDTVELLTCELVTNAIVHVRTPCRLRLSEPRAGVLRVEVHDDADVDLALTPAAPRATGAEGRGLMLVDALAASWGTTSERDGKTVWFDVYV